MRKSKNVSILALIAILALVSLGQSGPVSTAAPDSIPLTPFLLPTVTGVGANPTGIAVDEVHDYIYVSSQGGNHLTRINGSNWSQKYSATGIVYQPMGLAVNPTNQRVYTCDSPNHFSIVNGKDLSLIHQVALGTGSDPRDVVINPSQGYAYVTDFAQDRAYAVNMNSYVKSDIDGVDPGGTKIALSPDGKVAYVTCYASDGVDVIDAINRELVARYFVHYDKPVGIAVNPLNGYLYVANSGNGTVTVVDDQNNLLHTIPVGGSGVIKGTAYNSNTNHIFVTQDGSPGHVHVYNGSSYAFVATLTVQNDPNAYIAVDTTRDRVYVTNQGSGSVSVIQDCTNGSSTDQGFGRFVESQDCAGHGYEPNDLPVQANPIHNDIPQLHSIDPVGDVDWVKFTVGASKTLATSKPVTLTLSTMDILSGTYTTTLSLYDTDGTTPLVTETNPIVFPFSTTGTYYVKASATDPNVGDPTYRYILLVAWEDIGYRTYLPLLLRNKSTQR